MRDDVPRKAPGPADMSLPGTDTGSTNRKTDARTTETNEDTGIHIPVSEDATPTAAVFLTELQEIRQSVDRMVIITTALNYAYLALLALGVYYIVRSGKGVNGTGTT